MATIKVKRRHTTGGTASTTDGELSVNSFDKKIFIGNGSTAVEIANQIGYSTIATVGTITSGTWNATTIGATYGGTGQTTYAVGDLLYASTTSALSKLTIGASNYVLTSDGTNPVWTANTGTGNVVRASSPSITSPTLTTPILGTPQSGTLTSCTGLPISTGVSGLGTGVATFLATPTSANLASAITNETGSGSLVFATSPTLVTPILGTPTSGTLTNCTGLPVSTGISGLGTGVATFLATPSSANLAAAVTGETGTAGSLVFNTSPTFDTSVTISKSSISNNTASLIFSSADPTDISYQSTISCSYENGYDFALSDTTYNHLKLVGNAIYIGDMDAAGSNAYIFIDTGGNQDANIIMYGYDAALAESSSLSVGPSGIAIGLSTNSSFTFGNCSLAAGTNGTLTTKSISASRSSATVATFDRLSTDGQIISLKQAGTEEGSISVSGTTITYGTFSGSHLGQLTDSTTPNILRGTVMETVDELCEWINEPAPEQLVKVKISDTVASNRVYGVFMNWDMDDQINTHDMLVTSIGAFVVRISAGVTVQGGDLLESNGNGCARVQSDNIIRASTIGKVSSNIVTHTHPDGSYCVPVTLYCG